MPNFAGIIGAGDAALGTVTLDDGMISNKDYAKIVCMYIVFKCVDHWIFVRERHGRSRCAPGCTGLDLEGDGAGSIFTTLLPSPAASVQVHVGGASAGK